MQSHTDEKPYTYNRKIQSRAFSGNIIINYFAHFTVC